MKRELEAVLPLKIRSSSEESDLDRLGTLLLPSFDRFYVGESNLVISLIVPEEDLRKIEDYLRSLDRSDVKVISEDRLCPSIKGTSGWHKQQILKLAAARLVSSDYYLVLDADVLLKRPMRLRDLFPGGKSILQLFVSWPRIARAEAIGTAW